MKKFIPFKKEIPFKSQIAEITSISLEHTIQKTSTYDISGEFIVSGEYKVTETSMTTQQFKFDLPFEVTMSDIYDIDDVTIAIDDFYYEIKNMENLEVNITLLLDNIKEKPLEEPREIVDEIIENEINIEKKEDEKPEIIEEKTEELDNDERNNEECYEPEEPVDNGKTMREEVVTQNEIPILTAEEKNIFSFTEDENESAYIVYIVREGDTIETILERYNITIEKIKEYNTISEIKKGDKIIIPNG